MTLSERLAYGPATSKQQRKQPARAKAIATAIADSLAIDWQGPDTISPARCQHCGHVSFYVYYKPGYGHTWYALCIDSEACDKRAHGAIN